jgi:hypothetical protein
LIADPAFAAIRQINELHFGFGMEVVAGVAAHRTEMLEVFARFDINSIWQPSSEMTHHMRVRLLVACSVARIRHHVHVSKRFLYDFVSGHCFFNPIGTTFSKT